MTRGHQRQQSKLIKLGYKEIAIVPTTFNGIVGVDLVLLEKNLREKKINDPLRRCQKPINRREKIKKAVEL